MRIYPDISFLEKALLAPLIFESNKDLVNHEVQFVTPTPVVPACAGTTGVGIECQVPV